MMSLSQRLDRSNALSWSYLNKMTQPFNNSAIKTTHENYTRHTAKAS